MRDGEQMFPEFHKRTQSTTERWTNSFRRGQNVFCVFRAFLDQFLYSDSLESYNTHHGMNVKRFINCKCRFVSIRKTSFFPIFTHSLRSTRWTKLNDCEWRKKKPSHASRLPLALFVRAIFWRRPKTSATLLERAITNNFQIENSPFDQTV